ncbi:uncharacterized protein [Nicotiana tomentosiformis]|uniref:uncharacterized protein n=1 Tax=Nicotiana tomentosiformis TaxID=4098 RepID=UPI00051B906D
MEGDRRWMYDRNHPNRGGLKEEFVEDVKGFIAYTKTLPEFRNEGTIRCPCAKCKCIKLLIPEDVKVHLYRNRFRKYYYVWTVHGEKNLVLMESNIHLIINKLAKKFPCDFFNVMEHLPVHLVREARLGGLVQCRWMYPFERTICKCKRTMKQKSKIEGSICEAYLVKESSHFYSYYFEHHVLCLRNRPNWHDDEGDNDTMKDNFKRILEEFIQSQSIDDQGRQIQPTQEEIMDMWIKAAGGCIRGESTALNQSLVSAVVLLNCLILILRHIARLIWMSLSN